jgi:2-dehydro-3-deoxyphosphogluconate aldolase / (4S)-4-hydroxy-2-oxoglutarate aldolase
MSDSNHSEIKDLLTRLQLVPVVALPSVDAGLRLAEILMRCNLPVAEVTFRTPCAAEAIKAMKREHSDLLVLAGTVLTTKNVDIATDAGAECIVLPGFDKDIVGYCKTQNLMVCPGTATPTEVMQCMGMGIDFVKFFPAEVAGGVGMLKAMAAVFSDIRFMPTGGVTLSNMLEYLSLEAVFCCGGSWLAPENQMIEGQWGEIEKRISSAVALLNP